jgi:hypothetical protein
MELYETNYIRMMCLCPGLHGLTHNLVSSVDGALDLHLQLLERSKYTTTILLTYYIKDDLGRLKPEPNLVIRIYHDARQAEVLSRSYRRVRREIEASNSQGSPELNNKWILNRFLYKWLGYCRFQDHSFREKIICSTQRDGTSDIVPLRG